MKQALRSSASGRRPEAALQAIPDAVHNCAELDSLQNTYKDAADDFTKSAKRLRAAGDVAATEYALLVNLVDRAKIRAETTHRALRNHIIDHGCA